MKLMNSSTKLFRIFGIDIQLHFSWWLVFIFLAWSLSSSFFPEFFPDQTQLTYWAMGITASLLLFISVLLHELAHSLVAKAKKIPVESITLFFFGGVAGITKEEMKPSTELQMALAGPFFSLILAGTFFLINQYNGNFFLTAISFYLYQLNLILALFNLIPGYPLDGGRAFRAILYWYYKDLRKATKIAAAGGKFFAGFLVFIGLFGLFSGTGSGLWLIFLGGFLYFIAKLSYEQVVIREVLSKVKIKELMEKKFLVLDPEQRFSSLVQNINRLNQEEFVVRDKHFAGILDLRKLSRLSPQEQKLVKLKPLSLPLSKIKPLKPEDNAYTAFRLFAEQDLTLLPVVQGNKFLGTVTKRKVMAGLVWGLKFGTEKE